MRPRRAAPNFPRLAWYSVRPRSTAQLFLSTPGVRAETSWTQSRSSAPPNRRRVPIPRRACLCASVVFELVHEAVALRTCVDVDYAGWLDDCARWRSHEQWTADGVHTEPVGPAVPGERLH